MNTKLSHQQRFAQRMALTPQMRHSIQLLGMSTKDISEYIDEAVTKNPFLQKLIENPRKNTPPSSVSSAGNADSENYQDRTEQKPDFRQTLLSNIRMTGLSGKLLEIAEYVIYEISDSGYLTTDLEEIADSLSVPVKEVRKCLDAIQQMDPAGIAAKDVGECLQLQLKRAGKEDSLEYKIVSSFLNEVAQNNIEKISKALKVDKNKAIAAVNCIKKLNPRPAANILSESAERITPELIARVDKNKISLELNRYGAPRLKLYNPYKEDLDIIKDPEARKFLKENMSAAKALIDNLKRREETICKVATYILTCQKESLTKEKAELKCLTLKDVAKALGFHSSTISRAVSNKYIQINDKVLHLGSLLSAGIKKENGEITSKSSVKNSITEMIKNEDSSSPLTDNAVSANLEKDGIAIKQRTIAKYRKELKILPTYLRKRVKPRVNNTY